MRINAKNCRFFLFSLFCPFFRTQFDPYSYKNYQNWLVNPSEQSSNFGPRVARHTPYKGGKETTD